jgi:F-type H+-transporting ATPase subunit b
MLIDWFTVAAQIVNFLVLVFLLKHFLYGPIIRAMDRREEKVVSRLREADQKWGQADEEKQKLIDQQKAFEHQREERLGLVRQESEDLRRELSLKARREVDELRERWRESLQSEQESFLKELRQRVGLQVYAVAGKALTDLADASLEQKIIDSFINHLRELDEENRRGLQESTMKKDEKILVVSAFDLSQSERQKLTKQLHLTLGIEPEVRYETDPELICGVELRSHGCVVGWNLRKYLHGLEQDLAGMLEEEISRVSQSGREEAPLEQGLAKTAAEEEGREREKGAEDHG